MGISQKILQKADFQGRLIEMGYSMFVQQGKELCLVLNVYCQQPPFNPLDNVLKFRITEQFFQDFLIFRHIENQYIGPPNIKKSGPVYDLPEKMFPMRSRVRINEYIKAFYTLGDLLLICTS